MRTDKKVTLIQRVTQTYNPALGKKDQSFESRILAHALVSDMSSEDQVFMFGKVTQHSYVVRLNGTYPTVYNFIEFDGNEYKVNKSKTFRDKTVFWVVKV